MLDGPAEEMFHLQASGRISISFLKIAWGRDEWLVHEVIPGALEWEIMDIATLLARAPLHVTVQAQG